MPGWPLPTELTSHVFEFLQETESLANHATVCSQWQMVAERRTFSRIKLTRVRINDFCNYVRGFRRNRVVEITIVSKQDAPPQVEDGEDGDEADMILPLQKLFRYLSSWRDREVNCRGIRVVIGGLRTTSALQSCAEMSGWDVKKQPDMALPLVPAIRSLELDRIPGSHAWVPAYCSYLVTRSPRLEAFTLKKVCYDNAAWNAFTENFSYWPSSIRTLNLSIVDLATKRVHSITSPSYNDILGTNLRRFSQQLRHIDISACTWTELFCPPTSPTQSSSESDAQGEEAKLPHWPLLETFVLRYADITPAGQDLFICGESAATIHDRTALDEELMNSLYLAAGEAALRMPRLRFMQLGPKGFNGWTHKFTYEVQGQSEGRAGVHVTARWDSQLEYTPSAEVVEVWRSVSRTNMRAELDVVISGN